MLVDNLAFSTTEKKGNNRSYHLVQNKQKGSQDIGKGNLHNIHTVHAEEV